MFEHLIADDIAALVPYPPGKPLEELEREMGVANAVKLASNENPLGPSPAAVDAVANALGNLHRYPDGRGYYLKEALAQKLGVAMDQIVLGNGSNEIIELAVRTFLRPGLEVVFSDPTFLVYAKVVQGASGTITRVPLKDFNHDLSGLASAVTDKTRLLFLDNPNNPTGTLVPADELKKFMADLPRSVILILDEAYVDFVRSGNAIDPRDVIDSDRPVIFLRTFSKAYGLAGLRVGYGLAHREIVDYLDRVRQPFNVNTLAQVGALAALEDEEFRQKTLELTWDGLAWLSRELEALGMKAYPTQTNFMMIGTNGSADEISKALLPKGLIVRSLSSYGYPDIIRVNAGLPEENQRLIQGFKEVLEAA
jgi:histidinol-phosphate aminotransferase